MPPEFFDALETRDPVHRERESMATLGKAVENAKSKAPGWANHLRGVDGRDVTSRAALARLPVLRKSELAERQKAQPPFGGFAGPASEFQRYFMSPGPLFEPQALAANGWRYARALFATGVRKGDVVHNSFSYHLTPGGFMLDEAARAIGCSVIPGGVGNTDAQVEAIVQFHPSAFTGVPDFLKVLLDRAAELGRDISSIKRAHVSGGALFPSLRSEYEARGIAVRQSYSTADVGLIAYESDAMQGLIVDEGIVLEIVRPGTGDPLPEGEVGEVVVTTLGGPYPMIRLATGDMSAVLSGQSPCGRTNMRIKGWMGRADQAAKIKGMFVRPEQVAEIARRHPALGRLRLVVAREGDQDSMILKAESKESGLADALARTLADVTKLKGRVEIVAPGSLPNDGKVIEDARDYGK